MASARAALQLRRQCLAAGTNPVLFSGHGLRYRKLEVILTTVTADPTPSTRCISLASHHHFDPCRGHRRDDLGQRFRFGSL
uniref:Uncharacterized protein n=1 Tax=Arundo donax TaxID=35708 RepID=A0A0A8YTR2_ARUDO